MLKPCLDCGTPADGTRCPTHAATRQAQLQQSQNIRRQQAGGRTKYGGTYAGRARAVRQTATRCWLCLQGPDPTDPWQADHIQQGARTGADSTLLPAHRSCNIRRRHWTARGLTLEQIRERLQHARNPENPPTGGRRGTGHTPHPGRSLPDVAADDPAPLANADVSGVGRSGGGA